MELNNFNLLGDYNGARIVFGASHIIFWITTISPKGGQYYLNFKDD